MNIFEFLKLAQEEEASALTGATGGVAGTLAGSNLGEKAKKPLSELHRKGVNYLESDIKDVASKSRGKTFQYGSEKIKNNPKAVNEYIKNLKSKSKELAKVRGGKLKTIIALLGGAAGAGALMKGEKALKQKAKEMEAERRRQYIERVMRARAAQAAAARSNQ